MKPFSMHAVLGYRRRLEDTARQQLHQALETEARLQEALIRIEAEKDELIEALSCDREQGTTVDRLLLYEYRLDLVKQQIVSRRSDLEKHQVQVAMKRQQLLKASKERKIMEKLQEQQNAAYKTFVEKKELAQIDEIAVLSHERTQR